MIRAALLAARMTLVPLEALDWTRHLRVPAIVWVMRKTRFCRAKHLGVRRRSRRS